jgi:hypothetical protein
MCSASVETFRQKKFAATVRHHAKRRKVDMKRAEARDVSRVTLTVVRPPELVRVRVKYVWPLANDTPRNFDQLCATLLERRQPDVLDTQAKIFDRLLTNDAALSVSIIDHH